MQQPQQLIRAERQNDSPPAAGCRRGMIALVLVLAIGSSSLGQAIVDKRREYNVKAVNLYAFGRYVTWPDHTFPSPASPFIIGVFGKSPICDALAQIAAKKTVKGRPIQIRRMETLEQLQNAHILFVSRSVDRATEAKLLEAVKGNNFLLVGETPGFAHRGGAFNFVLHGQNVRFEMNVPQAEQGGLKLNAMLYSLGVRINAQPSERDPIGAEANAVPAGR